jgi:transposase-like protein
MTKRRTFKPAFKVEIVLEDLTGAKSRAEICREHGLRSQMVTRWKREFLEHAPEVFETDHTRDEIQARIAELEQMVGRLTMELAAAKKASTILSSRLQSNGR